MIVCLCEGVSERVVRAAISSGCRTVPELTRRCQAGGNCGACRDQLRELLREHQGQEAHPG